MARRRRKLGAEAGRAPDPAPSAPVADVGTPWNRQTWIRFYVSLFLVAEAVLLIGFLTLGGGSRLQREMLRQAEAHAAGGRHEAALEVLRDYGRRWPGANGTRDFERRLGVAYANVGHFETAAGHFERSVAANRAFEDTRALAGEAWWKAGNRERALALFAEELRLGNPENPIAARYLGVAALERGDVARALGHFLSLGDEAAPEAAAARAQAQTDVVAPAVEKARRRAAEQFG
ncbi:MAG: tetratricopeptide repeat protein [Candidatus Sumerlaeia bacterium]|nr:tetratricopeptide repeat protein [Candidatus Sumerlaeia bacterium]